jgi:aryl-alcohol dehydrogenase-like predicted oxidoreductase
MHLSLEASLKKLRTSYVDILYVHWLVDDINGKELTNDTI